MKQRFEELTATAANNPVKPRIATRTLCRSTREGKVLSHFKDYIVSKGLLSKLLYH